MLQELLTGKVFLRNTLLFEPRHHLGFRGNARMVRSRHPTCVLSVHSCLSYEHVIECVVENVPHVQDSSHVRWRNDYGVRLPGIRLRMKKLVVGPIGVPLLFNRRRVVFSI